MGGRARWLGAAGLAFALAGVLTACTGSGQGSSTSAGGAVGAPAQDKAAPNAAAAPNAGRQDSAADSAASITLRPALIRTAELAVAVHDVPAEAAAAGAAARAAGGAVAGDDRSGSGADAHATLVLKVPPEKMDAMLDQLGRLGREHSRSSSTQDVTQDVADVDARVASMQASIARVRAILSRAERIGDVVSVEGELSRRTTDLESLQARQRALAGQVNYATITLQLTADRAAAPAPPPDQAGFLGGLRGGWHAFAATLGWVFAALGAVLPFLLLAVPVAVAWVVLRRRRLTAAPSAPAPRAE
ncbi:MAG TPA: DUF4349 domain-containing protein [Mycobacteriales bacterium]|jgi:hypothetical protein